MWLSVDSQHTGLTSGGARLFFCSTACELFPDWGSNLCPLRQQAFAEPLDCQGRPALKNLEPPKRWQRIHKRVMKTHQSIPLTWALISSGHKGDEELKPWYLHGQREFRLWVTLHGAVLKMKLDPQPSPVCPQLSALQLKARHRGPAAKPACTESERGPSGRQQGHGTPLLSLCVPPRPPAPIERQGMSAPY